MIRKSYYLREDQIKYIEALPGDAAGHVRLALDDYINKKKNEKINVSASRSEIKKVMDKNYGL